MSQISTERVLKKQLLS